MIELAFRSGFKINLNLGPNSPFEAPANVACNYEIKSNIFNVNLNKLVKYVIHFNYIKS